MDLPSINTSFDDLFDNNAERGWIVTQKEKGKVKVARCPEDESDKSSTTEWFVKNVDEDKPRQFSSAKLPNWRLYGTAMFLIADLLNCPYKNNYFICKNVPFLRVLFWGTVVSASIYFDRYSIVVDDGTSKITCLIKQDELKALRLTEEQKRKHIKLCEEFKANRKDPVLKAQIVMMGKLKDAVKNTPSFEDLKLGDIVSILGKLSEYKGKRYIFINSIEKEPEDSNYYITHLERLMNLYTNKYENS